MKLKLFILAIFAISFVLGFSSCSKSPRDKLVNVLENVYDWINSEKFDSEIQAIIDKDPNSLFENYRKRLDKFIIDDGFENTAEFDSLYREFSNDPEIKELINKINKLSSEKINPKMQKIREKMQQEMQEQMQNQQQEMQADSSAK